MLPLVCPECHLAVHATSLFLSGGRTRWSVSNRDRPAFAAACRHQTGGPPGAFPGELLSCPSMERAACLLVPSTRDRDEPGEFGADKPAPDISIAAIARSVRDVEYRGHPPRERRPVIGASFPPEAVSLFQENPGTATIRCFDLGEVDLLPACAALSRDGRIVAETRYLFDEADYHREQAARRPMTVVDGGGIAIVGFNGAYGNYYHWMTQCLPAIAWSAQGTAPDAFRLAVPPLAPWQVETLALLGVDGLERIEIDLTRRYRLSVARYCEFLNGSAAFFLSPACLEVLDRLAAGVGRPGGLPERVFVARSGSPNRPVTNEDELRHLFEKYGFITICPEQWRVRDQIMIFRAARFIAGVHGAGMTNIVFCDPGVKILELFPRGYLNPVAERLAQGRDFEYHAECSADAEEPAGSWRMDLEQVERKLISFLL